MKKPPFMRNPYNYDMNEASDESGLKCEDRSLAQQHMLADTDINVLMDRYVTTGEIPQLRTPPLQGDFTRTQTYQEALNMMIEANRSFMALPAKVRNRFENDPAQFVDFCSNEANRDEMRQMGLWSDEATKLWQEQHDAEKTRLEGLQRDGEAFRKQKETPPARGGKGGD